MAERNIVLVGVFHYDFHQSYPFVSWLAFKKKYLMLLNKLLIFSLSVVHPAQDGRKTSFWPLKSISLCSLFSPDLSERL